MFARPRRSVLYMPGSNAKALAKAATLPADALILDLEDSVAPDQKVAARGEVAEAVRKGGFGGREVVIRVNGPHTPWGEDGSRRRFRRRAGRDPLAQGRRSRRDHGRRPGVARSGAPERTRLWAMMETPNAVLNAGSIAAVAANSTSRLTVMVMGLNDLAKETRARLTPGRPTMTAWLASCAVAARAHGVDIIDGVYQRHQGSRRLPPRMPARARHGPRRQDPHPPEPDRDLQRSLRPAPAEVEGARAIIEAFALPENAGKGAIQLNGRMVELLHADMARRTLAIADAIEALHQAAA